MALTQPTNLFPSSFRGEGGDVVDATVANDFSLQLNGNSACTKYSLTIMQNDTDSTVVYSTGVVTLSTPIYPRDYQNNVQRLTISVPSNSGMTNGYANGYKWQATLYWSNSDSITSSDTFFWAQADPSFTVVNPPTTLTTKTLSLSATYTQANSVPIEWYRWTLTDSTGAVIADTEQVYSQDVRFIVDGLLSGETFIYSLTGQTQGGVTIPAVTGTFNVNYSSPTVEGLVETSCDKGTGAITVSFPQLAVINGEAATQNYSYIQNMPIPGEIAINIGTGNTVTFDEINAQPMEIPSDVTHIWSGRPTGNSTLYRFVDSGGQIGELSYNNGNITYMYAGATVISVAKSDPQERWFNVIMYQNTITLQVWKLGNVLYPSQTLYPSLTLYPNSGTTWEDDGRYTA